MKPAKFLIILLLCIAMIFVMTGCPSPIDMKKIPDVFPNSTWSTENGEIQFRVTEEYVVRFSGAEPISNGSSVEVQPLQTNMFGEIKVDGNTYKFFVDSHPYCYQISLVSEDLPSTTDDFYKTYDEYVLVYFDVQYVSKTHFIATVTYSTIFEEGTVFDFYRTDAH